MSLTDNINLNKILSMKKLLFISCVFTALSQVAFAKPDYIAMMQNCDTEYENARILVIHNVAQ